MIKNDFKIENQLVCQSGFWPFKCENLSLDLVRNDREKVKISALPGN
jgi:hypothetical protein